jgi:flavodoxin
MTEDPNILIAYFSRKCNNYSGGGIVKLKVGNTEVAAGMIQRLAGGDLFKIETVKEYPADYEETTALAQKELREGARPELASRVEGMGDYDTVFLGYPNWWGTMPMALFSFLDSYDFSGKTIVPFCTNEGSGMGRSEDDIKKLCSGAKVLKGISIRGGGVNEEEDFIAAWLKKLGLLD